MNSFRSTTQDDDDDVFAPCANPLWVTGGHYTSAQQEIDHHNFNAANDMASLPAPITPMGTFTRLLTEENHDRMYPVSKQRFEPRQNLRCCAVGRP
jgi:hypothetical protein